MSETNRPRAVASSNEVLWTLLKLLSHDQNCHSRGGALILVRLTIRKLLGRKYLPYHSVLRWATFGQLPTYTLCKLLILDFLIFQVQISYTLNSGMRCLRVLSKSHEVTQDRKQMEEVRLSQTSHFKLLLSPLNLLDFFGEHAQLLFVDR